MLRDSTLSLAVLCMKIAFAMKELRYQESRKGETPDPSRGMLHCAGQLLSQQGEKNMSTFRRESRLSEAPDPSRAWRLEASRSRC